MTSFPPVFTTGQQALIRQPNQRFMQLLLLCPSTVVFQTQPLAAVDGALPYLSVAWDGTDQGAYTDVQVGMTVLFSTTADYKATAFFRGRIRLTPTAATLYINETSANLADTDYITVLDDYDVHERLEQRTAGGAALKDGTLTYSKLPPVISGLQSSYVDTDGGATVTFAFAPTVTASDAGATISSYLWDVADGTPDPDLTTKDISVEFPGAATNEHRWVRLTVEDSNEIEQYFVFEVFTVDRHESSPTTVLLTADQLSITATIDEGYNATVRAWDGVSAVLDRTRCTVVSVDNYNDCKALAFESGGTTEIVAGNTIEGATSGATAVVVAVDLDSGTWAGGDAVGTLWVNQQVGTFEAENLDVGVTTNLATITADSITTPLTTNVAFVGRLSNESSPVTGDARHGVLSDTTFNIKGFAAQLISDIKGPGLYLTTATAATQWGQITTMTIGRALVYLLAWHTTLLNVCSLTLPSDIHDYDWDAFEIPPAPGLEWLHSVSGNINAPLVFAPAGECTFQRHASYAGVSGLDTILTLETNAALGVSDLDTWSLDLEYIPTNAQALAGAATYNTTTGKITAYRGRAPAQQYGPGWGTAPINAQIMKSDLTATQAKVETGARVAAHLAYSNPHERLAATLVDGLYCLVPSVHQLYTFTIAAADSPRGRAYTSADKWLLTELSYTHTASGRYIPQATFEIVTTGGNYGIVVTQVVDVNDLGFPALPPVGAGLGDFDPLANYPIDDPDYELGGVGGGLTQPGDPPSPPETGCDQLNVSMRTGVSRGTHNVSAFGETYVVQVEGDGVVGEATTTWTHTFQFDTASGADPDTTYGSGGFTTISGRGEFTSGVGWEADLAVSDVEFHVDISRTEASPYTITDLSMTFDFTEGENVFTGDDDSYIRFEGVKRAFENPTNGTNRVMSWSGSASGSTVELRLLPGYQTASPPPSPTGSATIKKLVIEGVGTNPFADDVTEQRGDAFYFGYEDGSAPTIYGGALGLRVGGSPPTIPPYDPSHVYVFLVTGTGGTLNFDFEDGDLTDNSNDKLRVTVCGSGMALSTL